jgi:hypothetical protein
MLLLLEKGGKRSNSGFRIGLIVDVLVDGEKGEQKMS